MRSKNVAKFDHDEQAAGYDVDVADETHPIRSGYRRALQWLGSCVPARSKVLDLGSGTGNTILVLPADCCITAVDVSKKMIAVANPKLISRNVNYIQTDVLEFFELFPNFKCDVVVSSYAVHHLTEPEKQSLFGYVLAALRPQGRAVFVDLMYINQSYRKSILKKYHDHADVCDSIREEFYWNLEGSVRSLSLMGFEVNTCQFSELSFGIRADLRSKDYKVR